MDYRPYFVPQSIAPILERGASQQIPMVSQPMGLSQSLPALGNTIQTGFDIAQKNKDKKSLLVAQKVASDYENKLYSGGNPSPLEHSQAQQAYQMLGVKGPNPLDVKYKMSEIEKNKFSVDSKNAEIPLDVSNQIRKNAGMPPSDKPIKIGDLPAYKSISGKTGAFSPESVNAWVEKILNKKAILTDVPGGMGVNSLRAQVGAKLALDPSYDVGAAAAGRAGQLAGVKLTFGGNPQQSARAANTVKLLGKGLLDKSNAYARSGARFINTAWNAIDQQSGSDAMSFKLYLNDVRTKMSTALQGGGVATDQARSSVNSALPDTITASQVPDAIKTINEVMDSQIQGALTPITANSASRNTTVHPQDSEAVAWAKANPSDPRSAKILNLNVQ